MARTPIRIQLSRRRGWRLPLNAVNVARPSVLGNPFVIGQPSGHQFQDGGDPSPLIPALTRDQSIELFDGLIGGLLSPEMHPAGHKWLKRFWKRFGGPPAEVIPWFLEGKDVACWCALDVRCHGDVLLARASSPFTCRQTA